MVYSTREHSKNKQGKTFCRDLFIFINGLFAFINMTNWQFPEVEISIKFKTTLLIPKRAIRYSTRDAMAAVDSANLKNTNTA